MESIHQQAFKAAEAANCAGKQGKYWEMHSRLFQNQNQLGMEDLPKYAEAVGLNVTSFEECLNSGSQQAEIRREIDEGRKAGVQGTPTFFLGVHDSDNQTLKVLQKIEGAQPYPQFKEAIESAFRQVKG